jgi:cyclic nucleotide-binding protein
MLDWFAGARDESIDELVRRKRYGKAVKLLRAELEKRKGDRRLRLRLGEILVLAGQRPEGVRLLSRVADDMALHGQVAQAIAVLKKIEAIEPGREDVEEKLAYLVERRANPSFDPWKRPSGTGDEAGLAGDDAGLEIGFEAEERPVAPPAATDEAVSPSDEAGPPAGDDVSIAGDDVSAAGDDVSEDTLRNEILALIEDTFNPTGPEPAAASSDERPVVATPLFRSLRHDELVVLIHGLRLLTFEPGQIIVSEGEAGASLFVLTSGFVRAYVRNTAQQQVQVRRLQEGDFFGEISVLSGAPRTATITAASRCELLELDKATLDRIAETHPHVREVLQEFHDQRKDNTLETLSRAVRIPGR